MTASTYATLWGACFKAALDAHGRATARDGTLVPPLTNDEAVRLIFAWRSAAIGAGGFPLWGQFAAAAYGWSADNGQMDLTPKQRDAMYPVQVGEELWLALQSVALRLDGDATGSQRLSFDRGFDDVAVQGDVASQLKEDGAGTVTFRLSKGASVPPKPNPKKQATPTWLVLALIYAGYRVIKNVTGGPRYAG